jgi:hypothetical protein
MVVCVGGQVIPVGLGSIAAGLGGALSRCTASTAQAQGSRLRRRRITSFEFVHLACLDSVAHLPSRRDHSAHIPDRGYFRRD